MKKFITLTALLLVTCGNSFGDNVTTVAISGIDTDKDRYFNEINEVRKGIPDNLIASLQNPFAVVALPGSGTAGNVAKVVFKLNAIVENRVKINNNWLGRGSSINGMRVSAIKSNSVVLSSENRVLELFLREKNENSIITAN